MRAILHIYRYVIPSFITALAAFKASLAHKILGFFCFLFPEQLGPLVWYPIYNILFHFGMLLALAEITLLKKKTNKQRRRKNSTNCIDNNHAIKSTTIVFEGKKKIMRLFRNLALVWMTHLSHSNPFFGIETMG